MRVMKQRPLEKAIRTMKSVRKGFITPIAALAIEPDINSLVDILLLPSKYPWYVKLKLDRRRKYEFDE
jgi:hypothetical protein